MSETPPGDEPLLPPAVTDTELADAVGVPPPDPLLDAHPGTRRNRTLILAGAGALVFGVGIAVLVLLGRVNADRYYLRCTTAKAVAEQGRSFPPWGSSPLPGAEWRAIALPPSAQCQPQELPDRASLEGVYLDVLLARANATLSDASQVDAAPMLDAVSQQLEQGLLLSRAPSRADQRKEIERLQGDVQYWRAALRLRDANAALTEAARQFDQAALSRPLHVSDAASWGELVRRIAEELKTGPGGATPAVTPVGDARTPAPVGSALPVEPPPTAPDVAPETRPDAGVPSGGVLL